jgi:hypothetical protein
MARTAETAACERPLVACRTYFVSAWCGPLGPRIRFPGEMGNGLEIKQRPMDDLSLCALGPILIDWLALVDGYCYVGRQRSWTWIKLDSARSAVPGSTRSANASVAHAYIY